MIAPAHGFSVAIHSSRPPRLLTPPILDGAGLYSLLPLPPLPLENASPFSDEVPVFVPCGLSDDGYENDALWRASPVLPWRDVLSFAIANTVSSHCGADASYVSHPPADHTGVRSRHQIQRTSVALRGRRLRANIKRLRNLRWPHALHPMGGRSVELRPGGAIGRASIRTNTRYPDDKAHSLWPSLSWAEIFLEIPPEWILFATDRPLTTCRCTFLSRGTSVAVLSSPTNVCGTERGLSLMACATSISPLSMNSPDALLLTTWITGICSPRCGAPMKLRRFSAKTLSVRALLSQLLGLCVLTLLPS